MAQTRDFWHILAEQNYALPEGANLTELTAELVDYLGSTDPDLRDAVAYLTLANWIGEGVYPAEQLWELLHQMEANLQVRLGEVGTDSVFLRSFSMLILGAIIDWDNQAPFLEAREVYTAFDTTLDYLAREQDLRGYVDEKGWAHSAAHTADTLLYLAQSQHCGQTELESILSAIAKKITAQTDYVYRHDEDERFCMALLALLERDLVPIATLQVWLAIFEQMLKEMRSKPEWNGAVQNTKNFVRSFYFHTALTASQSDTLRDVRMATLALIQNTNRFIR